MDIELELTRANRLKLARAFRDHTRVDTSIDCVIEGQMGRAYVDDPVCSTAYRITVGPFWYFAGEASSPGGREIMKGFPPYCFCMPSPEEWLESARQLYGERLKAFPRYSFSTSQLSADHLENLLKCSECEKNIVPLDIDLATRLGGQAEPYLELSDFDSPADFIERGLGYAAIQDGSVMGAAYSSLVHSRGIEVSIFVEEPYRRKGVATALAARLLLECLRGGLRPNWDAANPESCRLAEKLGYVFTDSYDAYYYLPEKAN